MWTPNKLLSSEISSSLHRKLTGRQLAKNSLVLHVMGHLSHHRLESQRFTLVPLSGISQVKTTHKSRCLMQFPVSRPDELTPRLVLVTQNNKEPNSDILTFHQANIPGQWLTMDKSKSMHGHPSSWTRLAKGFQGQWPGYTKSRGGGASLCLLRGALPGTKNCLNKSQ